MIPDILNVLTIAQAAPDGNLAGGLISTIGPFILIFGIFYLVLVRPQQKQQKELKKMLDTLKAGDRILTNGGILGVVSAVREKVVVVKIAENTKVEMLRSGIQQVLTDDSLKEDKKS